MQALNVDSGCGVAQIRSDLRAAFAAFPRECLQFVLENRRLLIRGKYQQGERGCLFNLLSRRLDRGRQIVNRETLQRHFTGGAGAAASADPRYQAPKWLVRLIDGDICRNVADRYGDAASQLGWDLVMECLEEFLAATTTQAARGGAELERQLELKLERQLEHELAAA